jgi:hypothetical protein
MLETARQVARKFLDRVTPADRVAVVFSASGRNQTFTNDRARLLLAIDSLKNGYANHLMGWDTARDPQESCEQAGPYGPKVRLGCDVSIGVDADAAAGRRDAHQRTTTTEGVDLRQYRASNWTRSAPQRPCGRTLARR